MIRDTFDETVLAKRQPDHDLCQIVPTTERFSASPQMAMLDRTLAMDSIGVKVPLNQSVRQLPLKWELSTDRRAGPL